MATLQTQIFYHMNSSYWDDHNSLKTGPIDLKFLPWIAKTYSYNSYEDTKAQNGQNQVKYLLQVRVPKLLELKVT